MWQNGSFFTALEPAAGEAGKTVWHSRLAAILFIVLFLVSVAGAYAVYRRLVESEEQQIQETLNHIADRRALSVSAWVQERLADATVFSSGKFLGETINAWVRRGEPDDQTRHQVREQLKAMKAIYSYLEVAILDTGGNIRISTEDIVRPLDPVARQTVKRAVETDGAQFSGVHSASRPKPVERLIYIAIPLMSTPGQAEKESSVLFLKSNADLRLELFVQPFRFLNTSADMVLAEIRNGQVVVTSAPEDSPYFTFLDVLPITPAQLVTAHQIPASFFLMTGPHNDALVSVVRKIAATPWFLVVALDQNAILAGVHRLGRIVASGAAGVLSLFGIAVMLWWRKKESEFRFQALRTAAEKELLRRQYDYLSKYANDMIILADAKSRIVEVNDKTLGVLGRDRAYLIGRPMEELFPRSCKPELEQALTRLRDHGTAVFEIMQQGADGAVFPVEVSARAIEFEGKRFIQLICRDITQRKNAEKQVQMLAYYDSVTMLPNRRLLNDRLAQAMHIATRSEKKVALLFMDLDNFKNINDSLGHHIGDMLLRAIAERLLQCVREEDTVARIGGDEFLVVLPDIEKSTQAVSVAEKILAFTAKPFMLQDQQIHTTISVGISIYPDDGREPHELIRHADSALYQAKSHGRDNYQFFTQELNRQIMRGSNIERQLREAIESGGLSLWYQPQIDTRSGKLVGAEALLRWRRDERDFMSPVEFIPVAEERGLISRIGEWAMREACLQCRRWQLQGLHTVPIAVNVSPIQFQQKGFADLVIGILGESQLDASFLELEITESAIMRRASQVAELAMRLREVGVGISIDDFGTGYSSLSYLKQIPIDKIKIDRSFIANMLTDIDDDAITYAIVNLAHSLNLHVIAEGVESKAQIERLRTFGCNQVQGYYYSSAVSAQAFERFLNNGTVFPDAEALKH